jgi:nicotinamidase-related amidase
MPHPTQLRADESALVVVDVQERLLPKIHGHAALVRNITFLIDAAKLADVPAMATEQYPRGLGPTIAALAEKLPTPRPDKIAFSACAIAPLFADLKARGKSRIVLVGIETHVCILNTALDLLADDFRVYLPIDAVGSRCRIDHDAAVARLGTAGAILTTSETVVFEWIHGADHPHFKEASRLVQQRMSDIASGTSGL